MRLFDLLHRARKLVWRVMRPRTRGVKVLLTNPAGDVLLVRHSYGSRLFMLPGGGVGRFETPEAAAVREVREELDCVVEGLTPFGTYESRLEYKRDTIFLFTATTRDTPRPDGREIGEAHWFPADALPEDTSPATHRRLAEYRGELTATGEW